MGDKGILVVVAVLLALFLFQGLPVSAQSRETVDRALDLAISYRQANRLAEACATFGEAERMARAINYKQGLADALYGLGDCARWRHDNVAAATYYKEAQSIYKDLRDYYYYATVTSDLGSRYQELGFINLAVKCWYQSLDIFQTIIGIEGHEYEVGILHNNLGKAYIEFLHNLDQAQVHYYTAYQLFEKIGNLPGEGNTLIGLGGIRQFFGYYREAINYYEQALDCYISLGDLLKEADTYGRIGSCYIELKQYSLALVQFQKAIDKYRELQDKLRCSSLILYPWMNPAGVHLCLVSKDGECCAVQGMCQAHIGLSNLEAAYADAHTALSYADGLKTLYQTLFPTEMRAIERPMSLAAWSYYQIAECDFAGRNYTSALENYKQAAEILGPTIPFLLGQARCLHALGKQDLAFSVYESAIATLEQARSGSTTLETFRMGYEKLGQACYQEMLDIMADKADSKGDILLYAERARARSLLDALQYGGQQKIPEVEGLTLQGTVSPQEIARLTNEGPSRLTPSEAVLVYAWGVDHLFTWVVTQDRGIEGPFVQSISYNQFLEKVYKFRSQLEGANPNAGAVDRALQRTAVQKWLRKFYSALIAPVEGKLIGKKTLIIVPSGPLWYVPFAALRTADAGTSYLIERYAVAYAPSLASLPVILTPSGNTNVTNPLLAFVDPKREDMPPLPYLVDAARAFSKAVGGGDLYMEGQATEAQFDQKFPRRGTGTSGENPKQVGAPYKYVLFGCHGKFSYTNPLYSYLALGPGHDEDGDLYAREALDLDLKGTRLVMLLACETFLTAVESRAGSTTAGMGSELPAGKKLSILRDLTRGDELVGLSRAFMLAGAQAVLATNWEVNVGTTSELASTLGRELAAGVPKAQALQAAQLELINGGQTDPWLWAPFLLIGNWR